MHHMKTLAFEGHLDFQSALHQHFGSLGALSALKAIYPSFGV